MAKYEVEKDKAFHYQDAYLNLIESLRNHICEGCKCALQTASAIMKSENKINRQYWGTKTISNLVKTYEESENLKK